MKDDIRRFYDTVYASGLWTEKDFDARRASKLDLLKHVSVRKTERLLDLGCGNGRYSEFLSQNGGKVVGYDVSKIALSLAKERNINSDWVLGTVENLPFKNNCFDTVFALDIIEHVQNDRICLDEISRVVKRKGKVFLSFPRKEIFRLPTDTRLGHLHTYQRKQIRELLTKRGFTFKIVYIDALFNYLCFYVELLFKRLYTRNKHIDILQSSIPSDNRWIRLGKLFFTFLASLDRFFYMIPLGNAMYVFATKVS